MGFLNRLFGKKDGQVQAVVSWPGELPPVEEYAEELHGKGLLKAALLVADPDIQPEDEAGTWIGRVIVGREGESWPEYKGRKMLGVVQINLTEAPFVPEILEDYKLITVFMAANELPHWPIDVPVDPDEDRDKWVLRAYSSLEGLVAYKDPVVVPRNLTPCGVTWRIIDDPRPGWDSAALEIREKYGHAVYDLLLNCFKKKGYETDDRWGTKIGGYPAPIQSDNEDPLALQLGCESEVGFQWIDGGCVYFWRRLGAMPEWEQTCEFY